MIKDLESIDYRTNVVEVLEVVEMMKTLSVKADCEILSNFIHRVNCKSRRDYENYMRLIEASEYRGLVLDKNDIIDVVGELLIEYSEYNAMMILYLIKRYNLTIPGRCITDLVNNDVWLWLVKSEVPLDDDAAKKVYSYLHEPDITLARAYLEQLK